MSETVSNGSIFALGAVMLAAASGTVDVENCRFYTLECGRTPGQDDGTAVTLALTTTPKSIAQLYLEATGESYESQHGFWSKGIFSDPLSGDVLVYIDGQTDVADKTFATGDRVALGVLPREVWTYSGVLTDGVPSGVVAMLAKRKDAAGSLAAADGDTAPCQLDAEGWLRVAAKGQAVVGLGAEGVGGFTTGGRAANIERAPVDHTSWVSNTMTLNGRQVVLPYALPVQTWAEVLAFTSGGESASTAIKAAGGAGKYHYVTTINFCDVGGAAFPTGGHFEVKDGTTVKFVGVIGQSITFPTPLRFSENTAINIDPSTAGDAKISIVGYTAGE